MYCYLGSNGRSLISSDFDWWRFWSTGEIWAIWHSSHGWNHLQDPSCNRAHAARNCNPAGPSILLRRWLALMRMAGSKAQTLTYVHITRFRAAVGLRMLQLSGDRPQHWRHARWCIQPPLHIYIHGIPVHEGLCQQLFEFLGAALLFC